jgi:hypothetical protein
MIAELNSLTRGARVFLLGSTAEFPIPRYVHQKKFAQACDLFHFLDAARTSFRTPRGLCGSAPAPLCFDKLAEINGKLSLEL